MTADLTTELEKILGDVIVDAAIKGLESRPLLKAVSDEMRAAVLRAVPELTLEQEKRLYVALGNIYMKAADNSGNATYQAISQTYASAVAMVMKEQRGSV